MVEVDGDELVISPQSERALLAMHGRYMSREWFLTSEMHPSTRLRLVGQGLIESAPVGGAWVLTELGHRVVAELHEQLAAG